MECSLRDWFEHIVVLENDVNSKRNKVKTRRDERLVAEGTKETA
jgi:hypothetical protein